MLGKLKCKVPLILTRLPTSTRHQLHKHPHNHRAHVSPPPPLSPQLTQNPQTPLTHQSQLPHVWTCDRQQLL